jgi:hypothetical protein
MYGGVERLDDGTVSKPERVALVGRRDHRLDLGLGHHVLGETDLRPWQFDVGGGIRRDGVLTREPSEIPFTAMSFPFWVPYENGRPFFCR